MIQFKLEASARHVRQPVLRQAQSGGGAAKGMTSRGMTDRAAGGYRRPSAGPVADEVPEMQLHQLCDLGLVTIDDSVEYFLMFES